MLLISLLLLVFTHQSVQIKDAWVKDLHPIALSDIWSPVDQVK